MGLNPKTQQHIKPVRKKTTHSQIILEDENDDDEVILEYENKLEIKRGSFITHTQQSSNVSLQTEKLKLVSVPPDKLEIMNFWRETAISSLRMRIVTF